MPTTNEVVARFELKKRIAAQKRLNARLRKRIEAEKKRNAQMKKKVANLRRKWGFGN